MAELQPHFDEFRVVLVRHIKELTATRPEAQTTEWYLLKYMRRIHRKVNVSTSPREIENTIRALIRFYLDAIDDGSELDERCREVLKFHHRSLRLQRNS
jgi:hypothetical protein